MKTKDKALTPRLVKKLWLAFIALVVLMGTSYIFITIYFANRHHEATLQRTNAHMAQHVISEKFKDASPFLSDGSVNKALFGDLMHDMMAVNQSIEVYLLDNQGTILYSVVLNHNEGEPSKQVSLEPIQTFFRN